MKQFPKPDIEKKPKEISVTEKQTMLAMGYRFMYKISQGDKHWIGFVEKNKKWLLPCFSKKDQTYRFEVFSEANDYIKGTFSRDKKELEKLIK